MNASAFRFPKAPLYLICDGEACAAAGLSREDFVAGALAGGARILQYRHKNTDAPAYAENIRPLLNLCRQARAMLIVNDHAEIAEKFSLPLHLGQGDVLPQELHIPYGRSTHNFEELAFALAAHPQPGYLALGTMFPSPTKPDVVPARGLLDEYLRRTDLPLVLIGGITLENVGLLPKSERIYYAVIGDAFRFGASPAGIQKYAEQFLRHA